MPSFFISLLSFVLLAGLIKPRWVLPGTVKSRGRVLLFYGLPLLVLAIWLNPPSHKSSTSPSMLAKALGLSPETQSATVAPPTYVSTNFSDFSQYFSAESTMTEIQKNNLFDSKYKNQWVKWKGKVVEVDEGIFGGMYVGIQHLGSTLTYDVQLDVRSEEEAKALKLRKGQMITYEGKLKRWGGLMPHLLEEGIILEAR